MNIIDWLAPQIEHFTILTYWLVFIVAFLESLVVIGFIMPGTVIITMIGFLATKGNLDIGDIILFATVGAVFGDGVSFQLGHKGSVLFKETNRLLTPRLLARGEKFLKKHGNKGIFFGRFLGPIRPLVPFVAGMFNMNYIQFYIWNILSAVLWASFYTLAGYFFGQAWQAVAIWSTRAGLFLFILLIVVGILFVIREEIIRRGSYVAQLITSILRSIVHAVATNKDVQTIVKRHPRLFNFLDQRLTIKHFSGLPLTLLGLIFIYALSLFFGIVEDVINQDPIISVDIRLAHLFTIFRNSNLTTAFLWITFLGKWQVIAMFLTAATLIMWIRKQAHYILPLLITIIGSETITAIGKSTIHRARPTDLIPLYIEHSFSFPSGHATIAMAFYGFIIYYTWQQLKTWRWKINALFTGILLIFFIGLSRLYLGVHFLSDVLSGYLVGFLLLIIGITVIEWEKSQKIIDPVVKKNPWLVFSIVATALCSALLFTSIELPRIERVPINTSPALHPTFNVSFDNPSQVFTTHNLPLFTETLLGNPQEPISLIIIADNDETFIHTFELAGWQLADQLTLHSLYKIGTAALNKTSYSTAPITPSFWYSNVHNFGFEKQTIAHTVTERHHARFWKAPLRTEEGANVYIGTASFDTSLKWLVTHRIEPDIDTERSDLINDLQRTGAITSTQESQLVSPTLGKNFSGDQFFTDGKIYVLHIKSTLK